jgi:uncharacterized protein YjiS (DUF1127 family)
MACKFQRANFSQTREISIQLTVRRLLADLSETLGDWIERAQTRRALAELDERLLRDVGLTTEQARRESSMPFWQSASRRGVYRP